MTRRAGWELLGLTTAAFFVTMVARLAPSPLIPDIMATYGVTKGAVGLALTGMWGAYALFQFPGGIVADRIGERRVILISIVGSGLASALLAAAPSLPLFAAAAIALGAAAGLYFTAGAGFLSRTFDDTGRALGIHEIGASSAGLIAPIASAAVAAQFGWRAGPLIPAVVAIVVAAFVAVRIPPTPSQHPDRSLMQQLDVDRLRSLLGRPNILVTTVTAMIGFFTWQSFASFFPTFLYEHVGLTTTRASLVFGAIFAFTMVGAPALGWLSDRTGRDAMLLLSLSAGAVGYLTFLFSAGLPMLIAGTLLVGLGLSWPGVVNSRFMDHLSRDERGTGFGLIRTIVLLVSSLGSGVTGTLASTVGWPGAYGLISALLALLVVGLLGIRGLGFEA